MVNAEKLKKFIKTVSVGQTIPRFVLQPSDEGVKIVAKSLDNTTMVVGLFKGLKIKEELPIKDANTFIEALDFVGGEVVFEKKETRLFLSSNTNGKVRSKEIGLADREYVSDTYLGTIPPFEYTGGMKITLSDVKDIVKQFTVLGEKWVRIEVKDGKLQLYSEGDTDSAEISVKVDYFNCVGHFGIPFAQVINNLTEKNIELFLHNEKNMYPIKVVQNTEDYSFYAIIAPKELQEEESVEEKSSEQKEEDAEQVEADNGF